MAQRKGGRAKPPKHEYLQRRRRVFGGSYADPRYYDKMRKMAFGDLRPSRAPFRVVDCMCGPGKVSRGVLTENILNKFPRMHLTAMDIHAKSVRETLDSVDIPKRRKRGIVGDVLKKFNRMRPSSVDVLLLRYGPKEIPKDKQAEFFKAMARVLKPGGRAVVVDTISHGKGGELIGTMLQDFRHNLSIVYSQGKPPDWASDLSNRHNLSPEEFRELTKGSGLEIESMEIHAHPESDLGLVSTEKWAEAGQLSRTDKTGIYPGLDLMHHFLTGRIKPGGKRLPGGLDRETQKAFGIGWHKGKDGKDYVKVNIPRAFVSVRKPAR